MTCKDCLHYTCKDCLHYDVCAEVMKQQLYIKEVLCGHKNPVCPQFADRFEWAHLPCKVGDTVYYVTGIGNNLIKPATIKEIIIDKNGIRDLYVCGNGYNFENSFDIFYLTREEAEKALKEYEINESL